MIDDSMAAISIIYLQSEPFKEIPAWIQTFSLVAISIACSYEYASTVIFFFLTFLCDLILRDLQFT